MYPQGRFRNKTYERKSETTMLQIRTQLTNNRKPKPDENSLGFGNYYTDHMLIIDHDEEQGWHDARIVPYAPLTLDPAAMV